MTAKEQLYLLMMELAQQGYCEPWMGGVEHVLWDCVEDDRPYRPEDDFFGGWPRRDDISKLRTLRSRCNGWWVFNSGRGEAEFVSGKKLAAWVEKREVRKFRAAMQEISRSHLARGPCPNCTMWHYTTPDTPPGTPFTCFWCGASLRLLYAQRGGIAMWKIEKPVVE